MNCCDHNSNASNGNNRNNKHAHKGGHMSHMWMMALCCGAPVILFFAASLFGSRLPELKAVLLSIAPFLCPIMMIGMIPIMFMHGRHSDNCHEEKPREQIEPLKISKNRLNESSEDEINESRYKNELL